MEEQGLTAYSLAEIAGMSERHVTMLRQGEIDKPRSATIHRLAASLEVPVEALLSDHPGETRVTVSVPDDLIDVLYALAAVQRASASDVVAQEVREYLRRRQTEPAIVGVMAAMQAARTSDSNAAGERAGS